METAPDPLLPAFYLLWKAAMSEQLKNPSQDQLNANNGRPKQHFHLPTGKDSRPGHGNPNVQHNGIPVSGFNDKHRERLTSSSADESVVLCTLECDQGSKFVKQVIHESKNKTTWSRTEDLLVDWLNNELISRHAESQVDVTIYFCHVPEGTTSDGISLWLDNLRTEGKIVNMRIKVASLGSAIRRYATEDQGSGMMRARKGSFSETREFYETEDMVKALRKLSKKGVVIEPISTGDWMQLMALLTDRSSLQMLDIKRSPSAGLLTSVLGYGTNEALSTVDDVFNS